MGVLFRLGAYSSCMCFVFRLCVCLLSAAVVEFLFNLLNTFENCCLLFVSLIVVRCLLFVGPEKSF